MSRFPRALVGPVILASAVVLAACGTGTSTQPSAGSSTSKAAASATAQSATQRNDADAAFATDMIPHHAQAVQMADLAPAQAQSPAVKTLATRVKASQDPEIVTMTGWLTSWGKPVPGTMAGHDMGSMSSAGGMMSSQQMDELGKASGGAFDRMWVQMMIEHHQGAVAMAKTELGAGANAEAKKLAQQIIDAQTKEIDEMTALLKTLNG